MYVVGATDPRGPEILRWEMAPSINDAVAKVSCAFAFLYMAGVEFALISQAKVFLNNPDAKVTLFRCPPVGYVKIKGASTVSPEPEATPVAKA